MKDLLMIAMGGAVGSLGRYGLTVLVSLLSLRPEWATFAANACGSFLIGLGLSAAARSEWSLFYTVGLCGGFTTFSTFSSQAMRLLHDGQWLCGGLYILGSVLVSLVMVWCGWQCRRMIG